MERKHTYLKTHKLHARVLSFAVNDEYARLKERAAASTAKRAAKTLVKEGALRITLVALGRGAALSTHRVEGALSAQVVRGSVRFTTPDGEIRARQGALLAFDRNVAHAAVALTDSALLITTAMS